MESETFAVVANFRVGNWKDEMSHVGREESSYYVGAAWYGIYWAGIFFMAGAVTGGHNQRRLHLGEPCLAHDEGRWMDDELMDIVDAFRGSWFDLWR